MVASASVALNEVTADGAYIVHSVSDLNAGRLRTIEACGIAPGARLRVKRAAGGYSVSVGKAGKAFALTPEMAADVRIVPVSGSGTHR